MSSLPSNNHGILSRSISTPDNYNNNINNNCAHTLTPLSPTRYIVTGARNMHGDLAKDLARAFWVCSTPFCFFIHFCWVKFKHIRKLLDVYAYTNNANRFHHIFNTKTRSIKIGVGN
jgi:hypothetical protein